MRRVLLALLIASPLAAQTTDSAHVRAQRPRVDSVAASLARYCRNGYTAGYLCAGESSAKAVLARVQAKEVSSAPEPVPPPTPVPVPVPVPTPTPAPTGVCANEPAGFTRFSDFPGNGVPLRGVSTPSGWINDNSGQRQFTIVTDSTSPMPDHTVIAGIFRQGSPGGSGPFYVYRPFSASEQYRQLYVCAIVKHDANFDNTNGNAGTKFMWPAGDQIGGGYTYSSHDGASMDAVMIQQGPVDRLIRANRSSSLVLGKRGKWMVYEWILGASSANLVKDGTLMMWIDGVLTHQYTDVAWTMSASRTWKSLAWNPTYGGGLNPVPHDQWQSIDHIRISGAP